MSIGIVTKPDGARWSNRCDLCDGSRKVGAGAFRSGDEPGCSWCRAVRLEYGDYFYPITEHNKHLFATRPGREGEQEPVQDAASVEGLMELVSQYGRYKSEQRHGAATKTREEIRAYAQRLKEGK